MGWSSLTQLRFNSKGCRLEDAAADSAQRLADRSTGRRDTGRRGYPVHPSSALTTVPGRRGAPRAPQLGTDSRARQAGGTPRTPARH